MEIRPVSSSQKNSFNKAAVHPVQSWEWGEFRKAWGNKVVRMGEFKNGELTSATQIILSHIPNTHLKIATAVQGPKPTKAFLAELQKLAKKECAIFVKLEPFFAKQSDNKKEFENTIKLLRENGCVRGKMLYKPTSFWIDLTKSESDLMQSFHPKTRYNIRLAQRKDVRVREDNSDEAFESYIRLTRETVKRQRFYAHSEKYHRLMWKFLHKDPTKSKGKLSEPNLRFREPQGSEKALKSRRPIARLLTATYKKEVITAWILFVWHDFLFYPYGASSTKHKKVMANNLMMWEALRFGQKMKLKTFDLWGRDEGKGYTRFKEGYNPKVVEFPGSWDLPTSILYRPYLIAENLRWRFLRIKSNFTRPTF